MSAFQQGMAGVLGLTDYVQGQYQQGVERKRKNTLADLMGTAASGGPVDAQGIARAGGDPFAVQGNVHKLQDREQEEVGQIAAILAGADPSRRPEIFAHPETQAKLRAFAAKRGLPLPSVWDERILPEVQQIAQVWGGKSVGGDKPAGVLEFEALTKGFTPEQKAQAARVWAGIEGRASNAGIKFGTLQDGEGRDRPMRQNPRSGEMEVWLDGEGWAPAGGSMGGASQGGQQAPMGGPSAATAPAIPAMSLAGVFQKFGGTVTSGLRSPGRNAAVGGKPNSFHKTGDAVDVVFTDPRMRAQAIAFAKENNYQHIDEGDHDHFEPMGSPSAPRPSPLPISLAGQTPGEKKYGETAGGKQAEVDVQVANADVVRDLEARLAAAKAQAEAEAKARGELAADAGKRGTKAGRVLTLLDEADRLIDGSTGSGLGAKRDDAAAFFGRSTSGADAIAALRTLEGQIIAEMPRMEGPQSDADRLLYARAAGTLADPTIPVSQRKAASAQIRRLQELYAGKGAPPAAPAGNGWGIRLKGQ